MSKQEPFEIPEGHANEVCRLDIKGECCGYLGFKSGRPVCVKRNLRNKPKHRMNCSGSPNYVRKKV
jgi:hypothetical protein